MTTTTLMETPQMEMGLATNSRRRAPSTIRYPRRTGAARWWFARMREAVRTARNWEGPAPLPAPFEQAQLVLQSPTTRLKRSAAPA